MARVRDSDERAVRTAAVSVTRQISIASLGLVLFIVMLAVAFVIWQSQPRELREKAVTGETKIYVDAEAVLIALGIIGVGAVVFAAVISWVIARHAVRPLGHALQLQRTFVADASHELRTPLAVLDARLQLLQHRLGASDPNAGTVAELRRDTAALIGVVGELLAAAGGDAVEQDEPTDAAAETADIVAALRLLAGERGVTIDYAPDAALSPGSAITMPAVAFRRCVTALVDNALGHSPDGGRIDVALAEHGAAMVLTVADHGPGIRGIAPERIFERFAHSDPDGGDGVPRRRGFGIGLALVRDVAARNGGTVRVERTGPAGTVFVLELPRA